MLVKANASACRGLCTEQLYFELSCAGLVSLLVLQAGHALQGCLRVGCYSVVYRGVGMEDKCWEVWSAEGVVVSRLAHWHGRK